MDSYIPVPYRSKLTESFEPGQTLIVKGKTAEDSVRFTINLHNTAADFSGNDVPLHISVRFDEGKVSLSFDAVFAEKSFAAESCSF
ncbi:unnamed protein product [Gongylonema pulchrum]|uniref:Galectin n=1 Tax=Gongylonema pulchrum TaxID=637853 RepID=A0A183D1M3_9BILA|nr:unnamed protein product [Gongylonema pulchrum]